MPLFGFSMAQISPPRTVAVTCVRNRAHFRGGLPRQQAVDSAAGWCRATLRARLEGRGAVADHALPRVLDRELAAEPVGAALVPAEQHSEFVGALIDLGRVRNGVISACWGWADAAGTQAQAEEPRSMLPAG